MENEQEKKLGISGLMEQIGKAMKEREDLEKEIAEKETELDAETRPRILQKGEKELEKKKNWLREFNTITRSEILNAKKMILKMQEYFDERIGILYQNKNVTPEENQIRMQRIKRFFEQKKILDEYTESLKKYELVVGASLLVEEVIENVKGAEAKETNGTDSKEAEKKHAPAAKITFSAKNKCYITEELNGIECHDGMLTAKGRRLYKRQAPKDIRNKVDPNVISILSGQGFEDDKKLLETYYNALRGNEEDAVAFRKILNYDFTGSKLNIVESMKAHRDARKNVSTITHSKGKVGMLFERLTGTLSKVGIKLGLGHKHTKLIDSPNQDNSALPEREQEARKQYQIDTDKAKVDAVAKAAENAYDRIYGDRVDGIR